MEHDVLDSWIIVMFPSSTEICDLLAQIVDFREPVTKLQLRRQLSASILRISQQNTGCPVIALA
jgi:hypothetical protein